MADPPTPRPQQRRLRVVRDDEAPEVGPVDGPAPPAWSAPSTRPAPPTLPARSALGAPPPAAARGWAARLGCILGIAAIGTAGALGADWLVGGFDGRPALHLLMVLALPFWDGLPARLGPRLLVLAAAVAAIGAAWWALADLRQEAWWQAEVSFGLACALVGTADLALSALWRSGRTVEP